MKPSRILSLAFALVAFAFFTPGCSDRLKTGGAYAPSTPTASGVTPAPDFAFYLADASFDFAYAAIDAAFQFERDNRLTLWKLSPKVKHTLDAIRPQAVQARDVYLDARAAYLANPTPAGLSALQGALRRTQQVSTAAQAAVASIQKGN